MQNHKVLSDIEEEAPSNPTGSLFVSLYLVVLAFFIILNTIATIQTERTEEALESIRYTFSDLPEDKRLPFIRSITPVGHEITTRNYFAPLGKVVKEAVTLVEASIIEIGNTMQITIPSHTFFTYKGTDIRAEQADFVHRLTEQITTLQQESKIDIEFAIGSELLTEYPNALTSLEVARAGSFAKVLLDRGVEERSIFIGVTPGADPESFRMTFIRRGIKEPDISLDEVPPTSDAPEDTTIRDIETNVPAAP